MELKKSPKADLQNKRGLLLEIGLVVALGLVIWAFTYTPGERKIERIDLGLQPIDEEIIEVTRQEKPVEPPKRVEMSVATDVLKVVTNDTKVETDMVFNDYNEDVEIVATAPVVEEAAEEESFFIRVEKMPSFQGGGLEDFRNWVQHNVEYPPIAAENGISGKVNVNFIIEKDGSLTHIEIVQSPDNLLSEATISVLKKSPKWQPGMQRNSPVRVRYSMPIEFRIQN